jgi:riboflavin kinase/FMN adenylyltransferase
MTFEPHPREFFSRGKENSGMRIYDFRSKILAIKSLGVECIFLLRFNEKLTSLSAHDFIKNIILDSLEAGHIITGDNFYFGKDRQGDKKLMAQEAKKFGFGYTALPQISDDSGESISSSNIRNYLKHGDVKKVSELLGCNYHISGRVKHGEGRGQKLGFPTANISLGKLFLPRLGVYAVRVKIDGEDKIYNAVANLGTKPTFGINSPLLEVYLFDTNQDLYGKRLCVEFIDFIREEKKFESIDMLKQQIASDCETARQITGNI